VIILEAHYPGHLKLTAIPEMNGQRLRLPIHLGKNPIPQLTTGIEARLPTAFASRPSIRTKVRIAGIRSRYLVSTFDAGDV
jgi:hypothetical protein